MPSTRNQLQKKIQEWVVFPPTRRCTPYPAKAQAKSHYWTPFQISRKAVNVLTSKLIKPCRKFHELVWMEFDMTHAIIAHVQGMFMRECLQQYNVSVTLLLARIKGHTKNKKKGPPSIIPTDEEEALV